MGDYSDGGITVKMPCGTCTILVLVALPDTTGLSKMTFVDTKGYISISRALLYMKKSKNKQGDVCGFKVLRDMVDLISRKGIPGYRYLPQ